MNLLIKILSVALYAFFLMVVIFSISNASSWLKFGDNPPETTSNNLTNPIPEVNPRIVNADRNSAAKAMDLATTAIPGNKPEAQAYAIADPIRNFIRPPIKPVPMTGQNQFAFDLYQAIRSEPGNLVYSPYSISTVLAMAYLGAKDTTEQQMAKTLHFPFPQNRQHPAVNISELKLSDPSAMETANAFKLQVANSIWGQKDYVFRPEFLTTLATKFDSELQLVDFKDAAERQQASVAINQWVNKSTEGMIKELISDQDLSEDTRLILVNAIYFKAEWQQKFKLDPPDVAFKFTLLDDNTVTFTRMSIRKSFRYTEGDGYQAVELPYKGNRMSMVIVLPEKGQFEDIEKQWNAKFVGQVLGGLVMPQPVDLYMPKFKYEAKLLLADTLAKMGMPDPFIQGKADFSGMAGAKDLFISKVIHKAVIAVDETGTEAAAVTATRMGIMCGGPVSPPISMRINRPFLFFIRDMKSNTVLFIGRVLNPLES
jgi:serpin B